MRLVALLVVLLAAVPAHALTIEIPDNQVEAVLALGGQCELKQPYTCADYLIYMRNRINDAMKKRGDGANTAVPDPHPSPPTEKK